MNHRHELEHIDHGADPHEAPPGIGIVRFDVYSDGDVAGVLGRMREVLRIVVAQPGAGWPSLDEWRQRLPPWFVDACAREMSKEEADEELARWRRSSPEEQQRDEEQRAWSLADWLYWFEPAQRTWSWWDSTIESARHARVALAVEAWPFPWGALKWLAHAAGATALTVEG